MIISVTVIPSEFIVTVFSDTIFISLESSCPTSLLSESLNSTGKSDQFALIVQLFLYSSKKVCLLDVINSVKFIFSETTFVLLSTFTVVTGVFFNLPSVSSFDNCSYQFFHLSHRIGNL
jgi:hypothetical protein